MQIIIPEQMVSMRLISICFFGPYLSPKYPENSAEAAYNSTDMIFSVAATSWLILPTILVIKAPKKIIWK
jgi:hypothetical protein